jgi:hypothetical protein
VLKSGAVVSFDIFRKQPCGLETVPEDSLYRGSPVEEELRAGRYRSGINTKKGYPVHSGSHNP